MRLLLPLLLSVSLLLSACSASADLSSSLEEGGLVIGSPDQGERIGIYIDYQCPRCQQFHEEIWPLLYQEQIKNKKAYAVFIDNPTHPSGELVHNAVWCAQEQGKGLEFIDAIFSLTEQVRLFQLEGIANSLELSENFDTCTHEERYVQTIADHMKQAHNEGISSTPTLRIGERTFNHLNSYDDIASYLNALRRPE